MYRRPPASTPISCWLRIATLLLVVAIPAAALAQGGSWSPANGAFTPPRTLFTAADLEAIRAGLADPSAGSLYAGVYQSALANPPAGNSTSEERRARAALAKNIGFVLVVGRAASNGTFEPLEPAQRTTLGTVLVALLSTVNTDVPNLAGYDDWQWRSKDLIDYLTAYDMARAAGLESSVLEARARLQRYAGNLYRESHNKLVGIGFFDIVRNNHALMTAGALGMAAIVLHDATSSDAAEQPGRWIEAALWNIDNIMWGQGGQSIPGVIAGYSEGPHYFRYACLNILPFFRALFNAVGDTTFSIDYNNTRRTIRHPWYDPNHTRLYDWAAALRMSNGLMPPIEDSFVDEGFPELALSGNRRHSWPLAGGVPALARQLVSTVDMRANYVAAMPRSEPAPQGRVVAMPDAGSVIFRSGDDTAALYAHFIAEHGTARTAGAGHNQADETSFLVFAGGEMLALDPGYLKYSRRGEVGTAADHNMILVDGAGPAIGSPGLPGGADAFITHAIDLPGLGHAAMRTEYGGARIARHALMVRNRYLGIADLVAADAPHRYTWQLHGNGRTGGNIQEGTLSADLPAGRATWRRNAMELFAQASGRDIDRFDTVPGRHELRYDSAAAHTALVAHTPLTPSTEFLAVLYPHAVGTLAPAITESRQTGSALIVVNDGSRYDLFVTSADTSDLRARVTAGPREVVLETDGRFAFAGIDTAAMNTMLLTVDGTNIGAGDALGTVRLSRRGTFALSMDSTHIRCYSDRACEVTIAMVRWAQDVTGDSVEQWQYGPGSGTLRVKLSGAGYFTVGMVGSSAAPQERSASPNAITAIADGTSLTLRGRLQYGGRGTLRLYDALGRMVAERTADDGVTMALPRAALASGMYVGVLYQQGSPVAHRTVFIAR